MTTTSIKGTWWRYRYWVAIALTLCYSVQYLDRTSLSVLAAPFMSDLHITYAQYGNGTFLMLAFYGPMQAVVGWICDRFGARKVLLFSICAWSLATLWMAYITTVEMWYFRQIVFGILCATEFVPSARILVRWFSKRQRASAQAALSYAWILTPAWAPLVVTAIVAALGSWRPVFIIGTALGLIPMVLLGVWISDRPEQRKHLSPEEVAESYEDELQSGLYTLEEVQQGTISKDKIAAQDLSLGQIMRTPGWVQICVAYIVIQALYWATMSWVPVYLKETFGFSLTKMGAWVCIYYVGGVVGSLVGSLLSDRTGKRKPIIAVSYICTMPFLLLLAFYTKGISPTVLLLTLTGAGFFANLAWGPYYAWPAEIFSPEVHAKALGIINAIGYFFGAAGAPLVMSRLVRTTATGTSYTWAWVFVAALAVVGFILVLTVKEHKKASGTGQAAA